MPSPSLLQRLKERKLVQWALAYLAGAFVVFQLLDALAEPLGLTTPIQRAVVVVVGVGFFVALILAWYHGEKGRQRVSGPELLMVAALLVIAGGALSILGGRGETASRPASRQGDDRPGIAVLPCVNMSIDPEDEYLASSLHDEILLKLQKISTLFSIGRTSVLQYAVDPPAVGEIASALGVQFVAECSVQRHEDRIRLIFQLLDGVSGGQIWAEDYDRDLDLGNLLDIQSEIAHQVATEIGVELTPDEQSRIESQTTENFQAYDLYLLGRSYVDRMTEGGFERAIELYEEAISMDPGFARAHAGIAESYAFLTMGWRRPPLEVFPSVRESAERALLLDPDLPEAYVSLGLVRLLFDWNMADAEVAFRRAIELDANSADARHWLAVSLMSRARHEEALREIRRALELDPLSPHINLNVGYLLYVSGDFQGAVDHLESAMRKSPNSPLLLAFRGVARAQMGELDLATADLERAVGFAPDGNLIPLPYLGYVYGLAGRESDARRILQQLHDLDRQQFVNPDYFSILYLGLGDVDQAMEWLFRAHEARTDWAVFFPVDPMMHPLRSDPRFVELLRSMGLEGALQDKDGDDIEH